MFETGKLKDVSTKPALMQTVQQLMEVFKLSTCYKKWKSILILLRTPFPFFLGGASYAFQEVSCEWENQKRSMEIREKVAISKWINQPVFIFKICWR